MTPEATKGWTVLDKASAGTLSAPTYHVLRALASEQNVPVGVIELDMGPYYVTALVSLLGPVKRVAGSTQISIPERVITSKPKFGKKVKVDGKMDLSKEKRILCSRNFYTSMVKLEKIMLKKY